MHPNTNVIRRTRALHYDKIVDRMNLNIAHKSLRLPHQYRTIEPDGSIANVRIIAKHKIDKIFLLECSLDLEFPGNGTNNVLFIQPHRWIPANVMIDIYPRGEFIIQYDYVHHDVLELKTVVLPSNKLLITMHPPSKHIVRYVRDLPLVIPSKV